MENVAKIFNLREYDDSTDKAFIMATCLNGMYYGCPRYSAFDKRLFMDNYKQVLGRMIESPDTVINIACSNEDANLILGFSILSSDYQTIHWVFVKSIYRKVGIGKSLVPQFAADYTHATDIGNQLVHKLESKPVFNPFKLGLL